MLTWLHSSSRNCRISGKKNDCGRSSGCTWEVPVLNKALLENISGKLWHWFIWRTQLSAPHAQETDSWLRSRANWLEIQERSHFFFFSYLESQIWGFQIPVCLDLIFNLTTARSLTCCLKAVDQLYLCSEWTHRQDRQTPGLSDR